MHGHLGNKLHPSSRERVCLRACVLACVCACVRVCLRAWRPGWGIHHHHCCTTSEAKKLFWFFKVTSNEVVRFFSPSSVCIRSLVFFWGCWKSFLFLSHVVARLCCHRPNCSILKTTFVSFFSTIVGCWANRLQQGRRGVKLEEGLRVFLWKSFCYVFLFLVMSYFLSFVHPKIFHAQRT